MEYESLTVTEIEKQLEQIEQNRTDLEKALEKRRQQAKYELAQRIKDMIVDHGYDVADIASLLGARKRRASPIASKRSARQYTKYVDPENPENIYVRGVIPGWMKQKMQEQGYDASSKADREAFKANYLQVAE